MFGFICQKKVRETVSSTDNQRCLRRIAKLQKIKDCEDNLENGLINNVFDKLPHVDMSVGPYYSSPFGDTRMRSISLSLRKDL